MRDSSSPLKAIPAAPRCSWTWVGFRALTRTQVMAGSLSSPLVRLGPPAKPAF